MTSSTGLKAIPQGGPLFSGQANVKDRPDSEWLALKPEERAVTLDTPNTEGLNISPRRFSGWPPERRKRQPQALERGDAAEAARRIDTEPRPTP